MTGKRGLTLIEIMLATLIMGLVVVGLLNVQYLLSHKSGEQNEYAFANQKAMQMLEELRSLVAGSEDNDVAVLDDYDNGTSYSSILTTDRSVSDPANPLSGNVRKNNAWKYIRRINVLKMPEEAYSRKVFVRVYKNSVSNPGSPEVKLAETMTVLKTIKGDFVPTQVIDVFLVAIGNVPGWWSSMSSIRSAYESVLQDIQSRNPGFEVRTHWVTRLSYGRDPYYTPYINEETRSDAAAMPYVYFYPGLIPDQYDSDYTYYSSDFINERLNADGALANSSTYSVCDQYNHAMRYPEEEAIYNGLVAAAGSAGSSAPEPSLRMLLEKLNSASAPYKNAVLINLHGELLPVPPMRNYSDAAKDPADYPYYRVVTHPEQIRYNAAEDVVLRVYPYVTEPARVSSSAVLPSITIRLPDVALSESDVTAVSIDGNATSAYTSATRVSGDGRYLLTHPTSDCTLITLYSTPVRHSSHTVSGANVQGLPDSMRLYGMEYVPCPVSTASTVDFSRNLTNTSNSMPKNTARWVITLNGAALPARALTVETRIGDDLTVGIGSNKPDNISKTYVWHGVALPVTEKYQLLGDPRHCPYKDVVADHRYNWNFASVSSSYWPGFTKTRSGWGDDDNDIDVDRAFQLYREGLINSQAVWSAITGFSYYYYGLGGEFGSDMAPLANALKFKKTPWSASGETSSVYVDEILNYNAASGLTSNRLVANTSGSWYSKPWLGELYPDAAYAAWVSSGNLSTGIGNYYRASKSVFLPHGSTNRTGGYGCAAFFNGKPSSKNGPFMHISVTSSGTISDVGLDAAAVFNFPLATVVASLRPYTINYGSSYPPAWLDTTYSMIRSTLSVPAAASASRIYYTSDYSTSYTASGIVQMAYASSAAFVTVSGLTTQASFGSTQLSSYALLSLLYTFLDAGLYTGSAHIAQLPRVVISSPAVTDEFNGVTAVPMQWSASWLRWNGEPYTSDYSSGYSESTALVYIAKYSADNGNTWKYCLDGASALAGVYSGAYAQSGTSFDWDVGGLPKGSYVLRVEAFRSAIPLHYAYDQVNVYLRD
ncbi:MAG: prepilin-type N-terminal cleavage/methylation domain-containing protein [Elusimicrobiaceae bacterium]|nr:prepilin-type N-terminal cleavage/methylation domain-containing protein [Elusimicrobiaceae bacterium]